MFALWNSAWSCTVHPQIALGLLEEVDNTLNMVNPLKSKWNQAEDYKLYSTLSPDKMGTESYQSGFGLEAHLFA